MIRLLKLLILIKTYFIDFHAIQLLRFFRHIYPKIITMFSGRINGIFSKLFNETFIDTEDFNIHFSGKDYDYFLSINDPQCKILAIIQYNWYGIRNATYNNYSNVLEIREIYTRTYAEKLLDLIIANGFTSIHINGFPHNTGKLSCLIKMRNPDIKIYYLYHGSPTQHFTYDITTLSLEDILQLYDLSIIEKLGFVKYGLAEIFSKMNFDTFYLPNKIPEIQNIVPKYYTKYIDNHIRIGVFTKFLEWGKNSVNQFLAAYNVENSKIFVNFDLAGKFYLNRMKDRFVNCSFINNHDKFLELLSIMDVNLYTTLTECYPMIVIESLSVGVPCITTFTNHIFEDEPYLFEKLVVLEHDNPDAIYNKIVDVLQNREEIKLHISTFLINLKRKNELAWENILK